ncbi:oligosaccharide flippase family protein [Tetragenococcus halophilus]|uniref:oligosaccharide flippase family protein n=1 Tax=Tetragenococcus halophilus TaxID=51669 RepID=UPI0025633F4F|nr:oligosaccharide flippase family protein [Tetragenococcus halophilus]GMG67491.1 lipopolysaccharide biosynthesis protein [Tetragenococcus halophilus]
MKKTLSNFIYQSIFQVTKILLPFITIPIVSRALGPSGIGVYDYTRSIAQYFVLIAGLGIGVYGNRQIAIHRDNKIDSSRTFWEIFSMSFLISVISLFVYFVIISFSEDRIYFYYQSLIIIAAVFDISWFFMGMEDFKKSSLSSLAGQIVAFILILVFVNDQNDLSIYILIQGFNILFSQLVMWGFVRKYIIFCRVSFKNIIGHFFPALQYFIPKIAIMLYTNLNKTLLGWLGTSAQVGFYSNTVQINGVLVTLITTLDLVLLPRMSNLFSKGKFNEILNVLKKSLHLQLFFSVPLAFGLLTITPKFVPWFFGEKFEFITKTIPLVTPLLVVIPLGIAVGRQFLVPMNRVKVYNMAVINGAVVGVITNFILIPIVGIYGAIVATILSELFVTITRVYAFIRETHFKFNIVMIMKCVLSGLMMYLITTWITLGWSASIKTTTVQVIIGIVVYMILMAIFKANPIFELIKSRGKSIRLK